VLPRRQRAPRLFYLWVDVTPEDAAEAVAAIDSSSQSSSPRVTPPRWRRPQQAQSAVVRDSHNSARTAQLLTYQVLNGDYRKLLSIVADYDR